MSTNLFADYSVTIIVAGQIEVQPGQRQRFPDGPQRAARLAREGRAQHPIAAHAGVA